MHALKSSLVCISLWSGGLAHGDGVFIYKNQPFHPDKSAYAFRYDRVEAEGFVTWVIVGTERKRFEKTQFHTWVELPTTLPADVTSTHDINSILAQREEILKVSTRFPNAAPIARQSLELHNEWCTRLREGIVRHGGTWVPKKDYLDTQAKKAAEAKAAKELAEQKEREKIELETKQRMAEAEAARQKREATRIAIIDAKQAEVRELRKEIDSIEDSTTRLIRQLETLADKES
jgi:hypothetical protein